MLDALQWRIRIRTIFACFTAHFITHLSVRPGACAAASCLNAEQVAEQRADEVVVQVQAAVQVLDEEREDGQSLHRPAAQQHQLVQAFKLVECFSVIQENIMWYT